MAKAKATAKHLKLALVGAETLLGHELQDVLAKRVETAVITGYSSTGEGNFGEQEGEAVYLAPLEARDAVTDDAILAAGATPEGALKSYAICKRTKGRPILIDCAGHLEQQPEAHIVSTFLRQPDNDKGWLKVIAHPAASIVALVLTRLTRYVPISQVIAHVFEPASERGKPGITELHRQTTSLLAFKALEKTVFDSQLSFNVLPQYGEDAAVKLATVEDRINRHLAKLLDEQTRLEGQAGRHQWPMPSLRVIQVPVFHGYSLSLWIEFDSTVTSEEAAAALKCPEIDVRGENDEPPDNVGATSQSGLMVGDIRVDRNNSRAIWLWAVGDNLRLTADAAADIVSGLGPAPK